MGVATTSEPSTAENTTVAEMRALDLEWLQWHNDAAQVFQAAVDEGKLDRYNDTRSAFAITLLAGDDYKGDNATPTTEPIENPSLSLEAVVADTSSPHPRLQPWTAGPDSLYKKQVTVACRDRRLAVMDQGYVGLVPGCSQVGDGVYLLGGVTVPFVLRQKNQKKFVLVGDSYIYGVMEGELAETLTWDDYTPVLIY